MSKKTFIQKVKALFNEEVEAPASTETEVKFVDVKTIEGRILRMDDIAVGMKIVEITEDGEVALENATYELEDGVKVVVVDGLITEIMPAEEVEIEDEMEKEDVKQLMSTISEMITSVKEIKEAFAAEKVEKEALLAELKTTKEAFTQIENSYKDLSTRVEKFAKAPAAEKTETSVNAKKETKEEKLAFFAKK